MIIPVSIFANQRSPKSNAPDNAYLIFGNKKLPESNTLMY